MAARLTPMAIAAAVALMLICAASSATAGIAATIYSIRPDGTGRMLVLRLDPPTYGLIRSKDGQKIAYARDVNWGSLYVSDISGKDPVQIHPSGYPTFSPDGMRLALSTSTGLYVVNIDDTGQRLVADQGGHVSWSPDGGRIAYVVGDRGRDGSLWASTIHVASVEGGRDLTIARGLNPEWAPQGNRIAYLALRRGYAVPCFVDPDGSHRTCYHGFSVNDQFVWSPGGKRIAFKQASPARLAVVTADGRHLRRLPPLEQRKSAGTRPLAWSPDGRWLAYSKRVVRDDQIFVRPVDRQGGERRVTNEVRAYFTSRDVRWRGGRISYVVSESSP
jgi:Tol biopolymer transport system component